MHQSRATILSLCSASNDISAIAIATIFVITGCELVSRYFFGHPLLWVSDYSSYLLCVAVFFAIPELTAQGAHVSIRVLLDLLGPRHEAIASRVVDGISAVSCIIVAALCWTIMMRQYAAGTETLAAAPMPKWILIAVMFYGFTFSGLLHALRALTALPSEQPLKVE